jgi:biopolymer transport protein ExbD
MAMSVGNAGGGVMCDINTTPLIDVMLVLLVTLIVSLPIMTHAVKLDMPQSNSPPPPDQRRKSSISRSIQTARWCNNAPVKDIGRLDLAPPRLTSRYGQIHPSRPLCEVRHK